MNSLKNYAHSKNNSLREALRRWRIIMAAALFLAFSATTGVSAAAQVAYTVIDLGTLGGTFGLLFGLSQPLKA